MSDFNKSYLLETIRKEMMQEFNYEKRTLVFMDGDPNAKIMLVGEAPGADEDRLGIPFVGRAGRILNKMLKKVGLDRSQIAIHNIVPFRPPDNRIDYVTDEEMSSYRPYFERVLNVVRPRVVVAMGSTAVKYFLPSFTTLGNIRGRARDALGLDCPFVPTYHPAYCLRNPDMEKFVVQDLRLAKQLAR